MTELTFADGGYLFLIGAIVCYLIGCFNFAVAISNYKNKDIREVGSGNPGTMNMTRTFGIKVGALNFLCDVIKGGIPVITGYLLFRNYCFVGTQVQVSDFARYFFGLCAVIGHIFPVTMKFRGGKGIASTVGVFVFALPCENIWFLPVALVFGIAVIMYIFFSEMGSMGSLIAVGGYTLWQATVFFLKYSQSEMLVNGWVITILMLLLLINVLTWCAHSKNIMRLLAGEEHRTSVIKKKNKI